MKKITIFLLLLVGFFAGMIGERLLYPRTHNAVSEIEQKNTTTTTETDFTKDDTFAKVKQALTSFDFAGMTDDRQAMAVSEPLDICIKSQDQAGNYILGVGVTTQVLGERPPGMPEMMHNYWLFKTKTVNDTVQIAETIPTFSKDCTWMNFEEHQREADDIEDIEELEQQQKIEEEKG